MASLCGHFNSLFFDGLGVFVMGLSQICSFFSKHMPNSHTNIILEHNTIYFVPSWTMIHKLISSVIGCKIIRTATFQGLSLNLSRFCRSIFYSCLSYKSRE